MAIPTEELQSLTNKSIIELFTLTLIPSLHGSSNVTRFHSGVGMNSNASIIWQTNTYDRFPIEATGFEYAGSGTLPRPTVSVANILGTITALMATVNATTPFNDLQGAKFVRIRTLSRFLDAANFPSNVNPFGTPDDTAELPQEIYFVNRKTVENRNVVQFELISALDLQSIRAPKRQVTTKDFPSVGTFVNA
jgi:lambda family phage minor tail protein L